MERSESEPMLAGLVGNSAKDEKAQSVEIVKLVKTVEFTGKQIVMTPGDLVVPAER